VSRTRSTPLHQRGNYPRFRAKIIDGAVRAEASPHAAPVLYESDVRLRDMIIGGPVRFLSALEESCVAFRCRGSASSRTNRSRVLCARRMAGAAALVLPLAWFAPAPCFAATCSASAALDAKLQGPPGPETYTKRGIWFDDHRQFACAAEDFQKAFQLNPDSARLAYLLGHSLYFSGNVADAIGPLQESVRLDPKMLKAHLLLAAALDQTNRTMDAEIEWRAALAIDPNSAPALGALSKDLLADKNYTAEIALLGPRSHAAPWTPDLTLDLAMAYGQTGKLEDADEILRTALRAHPTSLPLAETLAATLVLQARRQEASAVLETAIKNHPVDLKARVLYLWVLVQQDEAEKAQQLASKLLAEAPHNWEVLYLNGVLERRAGEYDAARDHLQQAAALNPTHVASRRNLGSVLAQLKDPQGAREQLQKAIDLGDQDPAVRFELAAVLRTLGENQEAENQLKIYKQEAQEKSDLTQAYAKSDFADQKLAAGDTQQAIALYREALAANPRDASLAYKLAMALEKTGDTENERLALEEAIKINPELAEAQNQLGYLASRAGDTASAEEHFQLAVRASPGYAKAWVNLAATLYLESKLPEAKQAIARALQLEPGNPQAQKLLSTMNSQQTQN
jgi:Flp pilus assembly protein TadD